MRIRENLGSLVAASSRTTPSPIIKPQIGKVYGVITTENTPTKDLFDKSGGWGGIGTIFYLDYDQAKDIDTTDLTKCKIAKPFHASNQNYPLIGELVHLIDSPAPTSQTNNTSIQKYYTGTINIWNNNQQNSPSAGDLGKTFSEKSDIRNLLSFEGDRIYQGRKGNGIRFGSTVTKYSDISEWSKFGNNGDPITILVNGYVTTNTGSLYPNIEEINKELSSIYLTSTQKIPLLPSKNDILNPITKPLLPNTYTSSQAIINSDRVTLNSKKDEVMIFAKTNVEVNTKNAINLNADKWVHINAPKIILGPAQPLVEGGTIYQFPEQPMLLGGLTQDVLVDILLELSKLAASLTSAISAPPGAPLVDINAAGVSLSEKLNEIIPKIKDITSKINYLS
jgi:hypothetical protein